MPERQRFDVMTAIMAFEEGELDQDGVVELFQVLIATGMVWQLQGMYQRTAFQLAAQGLVTLPNRGN